jgi:hypothetical protein
MSGGPTSVVTLAIRRRMIDCRVTSMARLQAHEAEEMLGVSIVLDADLDRRAIPTPLDDVAVGGR